MGTKAGRRRASAVFGALAGLVAVVTGFLPGVDITDLSETDVTAPMAPPGGEVPDLDALGWAPVFEDEFDGGSVDTSVWEATEGQGQSGPGWFTEDALQVVADPDDPSDGVLEIRTYSDDTNDLAPGGLEHFTGELRTGSLTGPADGPGFGFTYGYVEARIKLVSAPNTRSAFWMLSSNSQHDAPFNDPAASGPEIDIFEFSYPGDREDPETGLCRWTTVEAPCDRVVDGNKHWDGFDESYKTDQQAKVLPEGQSTQGTYHTWSLLWTPEGYRMYMDGEEFYQSSEAVTYSPEHLILTQHQGGVLLGQPPTGGYGNLGAATNAVMTVDYVRVWQRPVSDIPDRTVPANTPVEAVFSVNDYYSSHPDVDAPQAVRVTATSDNQRLIPDDQVTVAGDGPDDPDGDIANTGFESSLSSWSTTAGTASTWTGRSHTGSSSLRLDASGGRVEQTITGLRPNTTYTIGSWYNLELDWEDANGDGLINGWVDSGGDNPDRCDSTDSFETFTDAWARFDWGIVDVDTSLSGDQGVDDSQRRNAYNERCQFWSVHRDEWRHRNLRFTTGPDTTQVTLYVANDEHAGTKWDSAVSFDSLYVRPTVPANRTVSLQPAIDAVGTATVEVTAHGWFDTDDDGVIDAGEEQPLGSDQFTVDVTTGSRVINGDFEANPGDRGWRWTPGAPSTGVRVMVDDPIQLDRVLELAGPGDEPDLADRSTGTVIQDVEGLTAGQDYTLKVHGKGNPSFVVLDRTDPVVISSSTWTSASVTFTATAATETVAIVDWDVADGPSWIDDVTLTPANRGQVSPAPLDVPTIEAMPEQRLPSSSTRTVSFIASGATVTGVTSSNPELLPNRNLTTGGQGALKTLSLTPVPGRTGKATVTVDYEVAGTPQTPVDVVVVVSDHHLMNPGFEQAASMWNGATLVSTPARSGGGAIELPDTGDEVTQVVTGLPYNVTLMLEGWHQGDVTATVHALEDTHDVNDQQVTYPAAWTGGNGWTSSGLRFTTKQCTGCHAAGSLEEDVSTDENYLTDGARVEVVLRDANPGDGHAAHVDDLSLLHVPGIREFRDFSIHENQESFDTDSGLSFSVGHLPANAPWDGALSQIESSDTDVLPLSNVELIRNEPGQPFRWQLRVRANPGSQETGRSDLTVTFTNPHTGLSTSQTITITVNAGDNFHEGDFQRSNPGGWRSGWSYDIWEVRDQQSWDWLQFRCAVPWSSVDWAPCDNPPGTPVIGPDRHDQVLRINRGVTIYKVTGLTPGEGYVAGAEALGDGSRLQVLANDGIWGGTPVPVFGTVLGEVVIDSETWAPTGGVVFTPMADDPGTPMDDSEVWIAVRDDDNTEDPVPQGDWPCALFYPGETCIDDIGLFRASDLS